MTDDTIVSAALDLGAAAGERDSEARAALLMTVMERVASALNALAYERVPVTAATLAHDRAVERQVDMFRQRYDAIDVSLLDTSDPDRWEIVGGCESERFEVREVTDGEDGDVFYAIVDTWAEDAADGEYDDEEYAREECRRRNLDQGRDDLCGFPFAHRWGYSIEELDIPRFIAAGFVVWRFDGELIAGIDGGGYSFSDAHWRPMWLSVMSGCVIDTDGGPRVLK